MTLHFCTFVDLSIISVFLLLSFLPRDGPPAYLALTLVYGRLVQEVGEPTRPGPCLGQPRQPWPPVCS